jgi:hypothetical protein
MLAIFKSSKVWKDISLYREYLRIVKNESLNSPVWSRKNLRRDWFGRIYTVINLPPEVIFSVDLPKESRPSFVMNEIKPINEYMKVLNLEEILTLSCEEIKGTNSESYLVVYQYLFRELSWIWIFRFILETVGIFLIVFNWNFLIDFFTGW